MHTLYFTPYFNQPRGNSTTSKRIIHFLQKSGVHTSVFPYLEEDSWFLPPMDSIDVIHILHATRFLAWSREHQFNLDRPYIVTMGGTDINSDLQKSLSLDVFELLNRASYITVFTPDALQKVKFLNPDWVMKTRVIPQSAWMPWDIEEPRQFSQPSILLPAGLRPVKDVLHVLPALDELIKQYPGLRFTILGAKLDSNVYQRVMEASQSRPWFHYAGVVPFEVMTNWYNEANIVINTSISEGQSLAIMEALAIGRPVIARRNAANVEIIKHKVTGWIYSSMIEFKEALLTIMNDPFLRGQVTKLGREWVDLYCSAEEEAHRYIDLYKRAGK